MMLQENEHNPKAQVAEFMHFSQIWESFIVDLFSDACTLC